jgi:hypothetical protein
MKSNDEEHLKTSGANDLRASMAMLASPAKGQMTPTDCWREVPPSWHDKRNGVTSFPTPIPPAPVTKSPTVPSVT